MRCVRRGVTASKETEALNIIEWKSSTNRRVVESSFAAEASAAVQGHSMGRHVQSLMSEFQWGPKVVVELDEREWQERTQCFCLGTVSLSTIA